MSATAAWVRRAFAHGYADHGPFPLTPGTIAACRAMEASPLTTPAVGRLILEAGRDAGQRVKRERQHDRLYAFHVAELAALLAVVLGRLDVAVLAALLIEHARQQTASGATVKARHRALAALALGELHKHLRPEDRVAMDSLNAAGWAHATAYGQAEADVSPADGPPKAAKVGAAAAAALAVIRDGDAAGATAAWTDEELDAWAMAAAVAAGNGEEVDDTVRKVTERLRTATGATKEYTDSLHRAVNRAFVARIQATRPTALFRWVVNSGNPCPTCEELAVEGPWRFGQLPTLPPRHPNCLCSLEAAGTEALVGAGALPATTAT